MLTECLQLSESFLSLIENNALALDCGVFNTKIVFTLRNKTEFHSVRNDQLEEFFNEIHKLFNKELMIKVFVTGFKSSWAKKLVQLQFGIDATNVEEISAVSNGFELISKQLKFSDIEFKIDPNLLDFEKYKIDINNPVIEKFLKSLQIKTDNQTEIHEEKFNFPNIMVIASSTIKCYLIENDRSIKFINSSFIGIDTMKGLSKSIVDSNNFEEITEMAFKGNRENTDTQVWEVLSENEKSPYGKLPPNLPIFSFGKSADYNKGKEDFSPNDLMESLSFLVFNEILTALYLTCKIHKIQMVYICGDMFNQPVFSKMLQISEKILPRQVLLKILNCEYISALGAMKK